MLNKIIALTLIALLNINGWSAVDFAAGDDRIEINDNSVHEPVNISFMAWAKVDSFATSPTLICKPKNGPPWSSPYLSYMIRLNTTTTIEIDVGNTSYSAWGLAIPALSTGTWYHYAATYDGTTLRAYINGTQMGTNTAVSGNLTYGATKLLIGANYGVSPVANEMDGQIEDVRVYNHAISAARVEAIAKSRGRLQDTTGLVGYWPLNDGNDGAVAGGATVNDRSGNGQTGTPIGNTIWRASEWINYP